MFGVWVIERRINKFTTCTHVNNILRQIDSGRLLLLLGTKIRSTTFKQQFNSIKPWKYDSN